MSSTSLEVGLAIEGEEFEALWKRVADRLQLPEREKSREMFREMLKALVLFSNKQHDYSSVNIAVGGEVGVFTRITDKWARLFSYYRMGKKMRNESIEDTWRDMAVYALIALILLKQKWRLTEEELAALLGNNGHGEQPAVAEQDW